MNKIVFMGELDFKNKIIFVSSPYSDENQDIKNARFKGACAACGVVMQMDGYPLSPIVNGVPITWETTLPDNFDYWKAYCLAMISKCDEVIVLDFEGWDKSSGVRCEIEVAHALDKKVYLVHCCEFTNGVKLFQLIKELSL